MDEFIMIIKEFGFPVVVTFYLLHRIESKLDLLIISTEKLYTALSEGISKNVS